MTRALRTLLVWLCAATVSACGAREEEGPPVEDTDVAESSSDSEEVDPSDTDDPDADGPTDEILEDTARDSVDDVRDADSSPDAETGPAEDGSGEADVSVDDSGSADPCTDDIYPGNGEPCACPEREKFDVLHDGCEYSCECDDRLEVWLCWEYRYCGGSEFPDTDADTDPTDAWE